MIKIANSENLLESLHVLLIHMKVVSKQVVHTRVHQGMDKALGKALPNWLQCMIRQLKEEPEMKKARLYFFREFDLHSITPNRQIIF